ICLSMDSLQPISLAWRNLTCQTSQMTSKLKRYNKIILTDLNGHFRCHSLNGLMGPSGAGKTTLLNCLCNENAKSGVCAPQGVIYVNSSAEENSNTWCYIE